MKVTLTSTSKIVMLKPGPLADGVPARVWEGETELGIKVHAFITRVSVGKNEDTQQFEKELKECKVPSAEIQVYPNYLIL